MNTTPRVAGFPQALVIIAISLLPMMAIVALMPIVPALIHNFQNVPHIGTLAPLVLSAPGLCVALFSPFAGYLTDRLGRRRLLIVFAAVYGIGGMMPLFLESFTALFAGRLILGVGEAFILTIGNTLLGDYFEKEQRAKWLMWQAVVGSACGAVLLSLSGFLSTYGWSAPFLVYGLALLIAVAAYFLVFEPVRAGVTSAQRQVVQTQFPRAVMARIVATTFVLAALYFVYTLHFSLALDVLGVKDPRELGNYSAIASLAVPIGGILYKFIAPKSSNFQFTALLLLLGIGMLGIGGATDVRAVVAFGFVQQLGAGMVIPVLIGWGLREVPDQYRGLGMGLWTSGFFFGQFVSPIFVSALREWTGGLLNAFFVSGAICIAIAIGSQLLARHRAASTSLAR